MIGPLAVLLGKTQIYHHLAGQQSTKTNGHAHLVYGLRVPVLTSSMEARQAPLRYLNAVEAAFRAKLDSDDGYSGLITKIQHIPSGGQYAGLN